jgi:hypothetical protein
MEENQKMIAIQLQRNDRKTRSNIPKKKTKKKQNMIATLLTKTQTKRKPNQLNNNHFEVCFTPFWYTVLSTELNK